MQLNTGVARKPKFGGDTNMVISDEGVALVKKFEGCKLEDRDWETPSSDMTI